ASRLASNAPESFGSSALMRQKRCKETLRIHPEMNIKITQVLTRRSSWISTSGAKLSKKHLTLSATSFPSECILSKAAPGVNK
uniref:Uncharacterized protein n=1 Tax=Erpetoichthys calabaricus TaxID=27687 RepID=A0A8C4RU88_ERPCA